MKKLPENIQGYYRDLEDKTLKDIVKRINKSCTIAETTSEVRIQSLLNLGYDLKDIKKELSKDLDITAHKLGSLVNKAGLKSYAEDAKYYEIGGKKLKENPAIFKMINTISKSSIEDLNNLTGTTGLVGKPLEKWYKETLNQAIIDITSGTYSRSEVMRKVVNEVGEKGLEYIEYSKGKNFSIEAAVKMNLNSTVNRLSAEISLVNAKEMDQDLMEITAHMGARPTHQEWQGQVVSLSGDPNYLSLEDIGYGSAEGFMGVNCRHNWYPFFPGKSKRFWDDETLEEFKYKGKTYDEHSAYQKIRNLERTERKCERKAKLYNAIGDKEAETTERIKEQRAKQEQKQFKKVINNNKICYNIVDEELENKLLKESDINWNDTPLSEQNAIIEYSGSNYGITNRYLRGALEAYDDIEWDQTAARVKELDRVLSNNTLNNDIILYRGVESEEFNWWLSNDTLNTYKSSSISKSVAESFDSSYQIIIKAPAKTQGFYIGNYSEFTSEKEFLINRNQKYKILKNENGILEVEIL